MINWPVAERRHKDLFPAGIRIKSTVSGMYLST
jgi:hypothetical protein